MATIRKLKSKKFIAEVYKLGQRKSKTFDTKIQATAWALETEQSLSTDMYVQGKTVGDAFIRYRDEVSPTKKGVKHECNRLNRFLREPVALLLLMEVKQDYFETWIAEALTRIKTSSVNRDLDLLSSVFEIAKRWRWIDNNPIRGIQRPKNPPPRDRRISEQEIKRILDALFFDGKTIAEPRHEIAVAFLFALETAMRQGEIWGLHWVDVYLDRCFVTLHETKNGTKRHVPLSSEAVRLLKLMKLKKSAKVFDSKQNSCATIFRRCLKLAGIKDLRFHDTRHEALTRLARKLDVLDLARMVGHRDPRSLMIYYNATAEEIAARLG